MNRDSLLFPLLAVCLAVGIGIAQYIVVPFGATIFVLFLSLLSFAFFIVERRDAKALGLLLLFFMLLGFLRAQLADITLLPASLIHRSASFSQSALSVLQGLGLNKEATTLLEAMLLGVRDNLPAETRTLYRQAGAAHVLALSGMHLGILFGLFSFALQRVLLSRWRYAVGTMGIVLMWGYALLTGFPVSLCRASLMMTLLVISQMRLVGTNGWHTLGLAAFFMLLLAPSSLFDIGFQLSFAAVTGILLFYAPLRDIWYPQNNIVKGVWQITMVSVAAQLAVLPLSLYWFHQFTVVSFITSPIIILLVTCMLYFAILFLLLHFIGIGLWMGRCLEWFIALLHALMAVSVRFPWSRVEQVYITWGEMILLYVAILCLLPPINALKQQPAEQPSIYRWALFFRSWPYLLATILLLLAICII